MKKITKVAAIVLAAMLVCAVFAGCSHEVEEPTVDESSVTDLLEGFIPGEYAGVELDSMEDIVNYYVKVYNNTKAETETYYDKKGNEVELYKFLGMDQLDVGQVIIDGKTNDIVDALIPPVVNTLYEQAAYGLPPCMDAHPSEDSHGGIALQESLLEPTDLIGATVTDNGDGTITLVMQPEMVDMAHVGLDPQGRMFNVLGDIDEDVLNSFKILTWSEGTTSENCHLYYQNSTATVTIDTTEEKIVSAHYFLNVDVSIVHANVLTLKDKSAQINVTHEMIYPISDEDLKDMGYTRA